jgi:hypothetical protein
MKPTSMPRILTKCPTSDRVVPTALRLSRSAFESLSGEYAFRCTVCDQIHRWNKTAAWLDERQR